MPKGARFRSIPKYCMTGVAMSTKYLVTAARYVRAGCTECHTFAQIDYVLTDPFANECRPDDVQLTREVIERWNEHCDDWEGIFNHD